VAAAGVTCCGAATATGAGAATASGPAAARPGPGVYDSAANTRTMTSGRIGRIDRVACDCAGPRSGPCLPVTTAGRAGVQERGRCGFDSPGRRQRRRGQPTRPRPRLVTPRTPQGFRTARVRLAGAAVVLFTHGHRHGNRPR